MNVKTVTRILITGASSAIMGALIDKFDLTDHEITCITRKRKKHFRKDVKWIESDLSNSKQSFSFLKNVDIIIHAAAISNAYSTGEYMKINFESTKNIVDAANRYKAKKIVYISSILASEKCGDYGFSKLQSENYIKMNFKRWLILRPSQQYGYSDNNPIDKVVNTIHDRSIIFCPIGDKKGIYPMYYNDLADLIYIKVLKSKINVTEYIVGPVGYSYKELIKHVTKVLGKNIVIIPIPKFAILWIYYLIYFSRLKIGIYPDQLYRFYHNRIIKDVSINCTKIEEYIKDKIYHS